MGEKGRAVEGLGVPAAAEVAGYVDAVGIGGGEKRPGGEKNNGQKRAETLFAVHETILLIIGERYG